MTAARAATPVLVKRNSGIYGYERALQRMGLYPVAGADEAGRGACAGPLVAAATILSDVKSQQIAGLKDSKLLDRVAAGAVVRRDHRKGRGLVSGVYRASGVRCARHARCERHGVADGLVSTRRLADICVDRRVQRGRALYAGTRGVEGRSGRGVCGGCIDHRQGDAGPDHVRARPALPGVRLQGPQGLLHTPTPGEAGRVRAVCYPPDALRQCFTNG